MAELADALVSDANEGNLVQVQVLLAAVILRKRELNEYIFKSHRL